MGAGKWRPWYSDSKSANVVLLPDEPGRNIPDKWPDPLAGKAKSVKVLELPGLADKGDVSDWLGRPRTSCLNGAALKDRPINKIPLVLPW